MDIYSLIHFFNIQWVFRELYQKLTTMPIETMDRLTGDASRQKHQGTHQILSSWMGYFMENPNVKIWVCLKMLGIFPMK